MNDKMFPMVDRITFGQWLQTEREKRGWSQSEFARKAGKDRAVISKIESGGALPAVETYISLANALNISPITLLRKAGIMPDATTDQVRMEDWDYLLSQLPPEETEEIRKIALMKIEKRQNAENAARAAQFKLNKKGG